jgi:hypothetical protein
VIPNGASAFISSTISVGYRPDCSHAGHRLDDTVDEAAKRVAERLLLVGQVEIHPVNLFPRRGDRGHRADR